MDYVLSQVPFKSVNIKHYELGLGMCKDWIAAAMNLMKYVHVTFSLVGHVRPKGQ